MTLSSAINAAMSGIYASSRNSNVVADNLANALTPGHSRRVLSVTSAGAGVPGVRVGDVQLVKDPAILASRRVSEADFEAAEQRASFFSRVSNAVGTVDDEFSLASLQSNFSSALVEAISRPDSGPRLNELAVSAAALAEGLNSASDVVRAQRVAAENSIDAQVDSLNQGLKDVERLNAKIVLARASGQDPVGLLDQRDQVIDEINKIVPVKVVERDNNQVALFSEGGEILLEGTASQFSFEAKRDILPYMTVDNGLLSGLEIDGRPISTDPNGRLRGGTLAAAFQIRDDYAIEAQQDLDSMARDLIERFQDPAVDPTLSATDAGIFTDNGSAFDPTNEEGLAGRISLNERVALDGDAETWRFRDGLNAVTQGDAGDATLLRSYTDALEASRTITTTTLGTVEVTAATLAADIISRFAQDNETSTNRVAFTVASFIETSEMEQAQGVDTDVELQNLLIIEQAYQANARVITVVNELMDTLLRI
ncbi:flagellar hook-associated protein FlgK [Epibacterium sp. SM1979]|uniref:Flagellar hook-associated protein 1 n=1 Tax=Tritonibacter litoralis TaxID=2662264 RepID=A0A843YE80_9RHOB|nr:flagellar hook-associated protein FlgK [Tritonibacter litoralis]MQQ08168.1 flagellar hook-associated protein FlgK [Tritonibacter litoralis]